MVPASPGPLAPHTGEGDGGMEEEDFMRWGVIRSGSGVGIRFPRCIGQSTRGLMMEVMRRGIMWVGGREGRLGLGP